MACMCSVLYKTADEQLFPGVCAVYTVLYVEHIPAIVHQHIPAYQHTSTYACMYTVLYIIYIHTPAPEQNLFPPHNLRMCLSSCRFVRFPLRGGMLQSLAGDSQFLSGWLRSRNQVSRHGFQVGHQLSIIPLLKHGIQARKSLSGTYVSHDSLHLPRTSWLCNTGVS